MQEKYKANMANMLKGAMQYQHAATSRQVLTTLHIYLYSNACTDTYIVQALHTTVTVSTADGNLQTNCNTCITTPTQAREQKTQCYKGNT